MVFFYCFIWIFFLAIVGIGDGPAGASQAGVGEILQEQAQPFQRVRLNTGRPRQRARGISLTTVERFCTAPPNEIPRRIQKAQKGHADGHLQRRAGRPADTPTT